MALFHCFNSKAIFCRAVKRFFSDTESDNEYTSVPKRYRQGMDIQSDKVMHVHKILKVMLYFIFPIFTYLFLVNKKPITAVKASSQQPSIDLQDKHDDNLSASLPAKAQSLQPSIGVRADVLYTSGLSPVKLFQTHKK